MRKFSTGCRWGNWFLNAERVLLEYRPGVGEYRDIEEGCEYYVPLLQLTSWEGIKGWTSQLRDKKWATADVIEEFQAAIRDIISPLENLTGDCSLSTFELKKRLIVMDEKNTELRRKADREAFEREIECAKELEEY